MYQVKPKLKSTTFWITICWLLFVPLALIVQAIIPTVTIPIGQVFTYSGLISVCYVGGEKAKDSVFSAKKLNPLKEESEE